MDGLPCDVDLWTIDHRCGEEEVLFGRVPENFFARVHHMGMNKARFAEIIKDV